MKAHKLALSSLSIFQASLRFFMRRTFMGPRNCRATSGIRQHGCALINRHLPHTTPVMFGETWHARSIRDALITSCLVLLALQWANTSAPRQLICSSWLDSPERLRVCFEIIFLSGGSPSQTWEGQPSSSLSRDCRGSRSLHRNCPTFGSASSNTKYC